MRLDEGEYLAHYGILRKSGRYPWGSGANPLQRSRTFLDIVQQHRKDGWTDSEIAKAYSTDKHKMTVVDLRGLKSRATNEVKTDKIRTAQRLKDKGMSTSEIGRQMGVNESTVRSLLEPGRLEKADILHSTAEMLRRQVEEKGFIDVGANVERDLPIGMGEDPSAGIGISSDKFKTALSLLKEEGYNVHKVPIPQVGTGETTNYLVLTKPGVTQKQAFENRFNIRQISEKSSDHGRSYTDLGIKPPLHIDGKRVGVRYKEDGGADADGVIYVRPGVEDITLGKSRYAQVRIAVNGTHYLKGMAVYKNDLPPGVDLLFNTNKSNTGDKFDALKPLKRDKETGEVDQGNPFGAMIKEGGQILGKDGKPSSAMNLIYEEGDWDKWSRTLSRQVLSKQSTDLAKSQLALTHERRLEEFEKIKALTNPRIRKELLLSFSDETDSAAVHLKAANMPRQANKVILPSNHVKPTEIFAPTFRDGERVVLVRFPHAGTFELPELTVNNRTRKARELFGGRADVPDAVVLHPKVAERLSGADFDGDSVVVIPNNRKEIATTHALDKLSGFDPQTYQVPFGPKSKEFPDGKPSITPVRKQQEMGNVTNLIADMTLKGANTDELARAVRHSMVVIDSEKHNLDFAASARDHEIAALKRKYQGITDKGGLRGASTLITRARSEIRVPNRKARPAKDGGPIDRVTGQKVFVPTGEHTVRYTDASGKKQYKKFRSKELAETFVREQAPGGKIDVKRFESEKLAETTDAYTLVSDHGGRPIEHVYADHSNRLKALANEARLEYVNTQVVRRTPSAAKTYAPEAASLKAKLDTALKNSPIERQAQVVANYIVSQRRRANPGMEKDVVKKIKGQALTAARIRTGAHKTRITLTDREWEAIQAGAISDHMLQQIIRNSDLQEIRKRATPRESPVMTNVMTARAKQMLASGYSYSEVSEHLGIPLSTLTSGVGKEV